MGEKDRRIEEEGKKEREKIERGKRAKREGREEEEDRVSSRFRFRGQSENVSSRDQWIPRRREFPEIPAVFSGN